MLQLICIGYKYEKLGETRLLSISSSVASDIMLRLLLVCALTVSALADVSHLPRFNRPFNSPPAPIPATRISSPGPGRQVAIVRQSQDVEPDGSYQFSFETENGIAAEEHGQIRAVGNEVEKAAQGSFSWVSPEGEQVSISYLADGNGYQPQGSHLPVAPPIPPAIQRALEWIAAHPEPEERGNPYGQKRF